MELPSELSDGYMAMRYCLSCTSLMLLGPTVTFPWHPCGSLSKLLHMVITNTLTDAIVLDAEGRIMSILYSAHSFSGSCSTSNILRISSATSTTTARLLISMIASTTADVPCSGMTLQNNIITKRGRLTLSSTAKYIMSLVECERLI